MRRGLQSSKGPRAARTVVGAEDQRGVVHAWGKESTLLYVSHTTPHTTLHLNKNREALRQRKLRLGRQRGEYLIMLSPIQPSVRFSA